MTLSKRLWLPLLFMLNVVLGCVEADRGNPPDYTEKIALGRLGEFENLIELNNQALFTTGDLVLKNKKFSNAGFHDWKQVNSFQLWFQVCNIIDRASQGTLQNEKFHIKSELGDNILWGEAGNEDNYTKMNPVQVDSNNCLNWSQEVRHFNYLAYPHNIMIHFQISSLSGNLGTVVKRFGFNPWDYYRSQLDTDWSWDLTQYTSKNGWPKGHWAIGEKDVIDALMGRLRKSDVKLFLENLRVNVNEADRAYLGGQEKDAARKTEEELTKKVREKQKQEAEARKVPIRSLDDKYNEILKAQIEAEQERRREHLDKKGLKITLDVGAIPWIRFEGSTKTRKPERITSGRFRINMNILASGFDHSGKKIFLANKSIDGKHANAFINDKKNVEEADDQGLFVSFPMALRKFSTYGEVLLLVKVQAIDMPEAKPFMAVYNLGAHDEWLSRQTPTFDTERYTTLRDLTDYDSYVSEVEEDSSAATVRDAKLFYLSPLDIRFMRFMPGETATDRTLQYSVKTCVEHGLRGNRLDRGVQFRIKTWDRDVEDEIQRQTTQDGCLTWFGLLSHKYYHKEFLFKKNAVLKYVGSHKNKSEENSIVNPYTEPVEYFINPWDEKFTFGWDKENMPENYAKDIDRLRKQALPSQLFIPDFQYETMGFRYAIDKYLNLKVKKSILLKAFPYVLKYNSIVKGRNGTEPLRDGIYLMKVALQKDYLDPAAKGVRLYDHGRDNYVNFAVQAGEGQPTPFVEPLAGMTLSADSRVSDLRPALVDSGVFGTINNGSTEGPRATYNGSPLDSSIYYRSLFRDISYENETLRQPKKRYLSIQQKLVRVMKGTIITPIEFEVDDLRLMRIRNQFFIQLQTIDEHKLRVATLADQALQGLAKDFDFEKKFQVILDALDYSSDFNSDDFQAILDQLVVETKSSESYGELLKEGNIDKLRVELNSLLGVNQHKKGTDAYDKHLKEARTKLAQFLQFRMNNASALEAFDHIKRNIINSLIADARRLSAKEHKRILDHIDSEYNETLGSEGTDPLQEFLFSASNGSTEELLYRLLRDRIIQTKEEIAEIERAGGETSKEAMNLRVLESLESIDFLKTPLTPNFSLDLLANNWEYDSNGKLIEDAKKSGLPSRTFVGPLTFVFNRNGSPVRPTDTLNERRCGTAFCEVGDVLSENPVMNEMFRKVVKLDENNKLVDESKLKEPIKASGKSINADYENDPFYGYLGPYAGMTVDQLIADKKEIDNFNKKKTEMGSQVINFVKSKNLKFVSLNEQDPRTHLTTFSVEECFELPVEKIDECMHRITPGSAEHRSDKVLSKRLVQKDHFIKQLNDRVYRERELGVDKDDLKLIESYKGSFGRNESHYSKQRRLTTEDINYFIRNDVLSILKSEEVLIEDRLNKLKSFYYRMCFVLSQNLLKDSYYQKAFRSLPKKKVSSGGHDGYGRDRRKKMRNLVQVDGELELTCRKIFEEMYQEKMVKVPSENGESIEVEENWQIPNMEPFSLSPIVFERKARIFETTGRYVYRGGRSLNISLSTGFSLQSRYGVQVEEGAKYSPYSWFSSVAGAVVGVPFGIKIAAAAGALAGGPLTIIAAVVGSGAVFSGAIKAVIGGFDYSRARGSEESASDSQSINVSSGTFLVSQQAALDIELGRYERCMIARFHPKMLQIFFSESQSLDREAFDPDKDVESLGIMICSGEVENQCLPVKEKYYYFTQHFTEGDMLDTADLHNHPWLLQLRGLRDYQVFTSSIGAREVKFDSPNWYTGNFWENGILSDAAARRMGGSNKNNKKREFEVVNQDSDIDWPLAALSKSYFEVSPTFPGLYTFFENKPEWPYFNTNPDQSFKNKSGQRFDRCVESGTH